MACKAHLVGSINLADAEEVFRETGARVGAAAARIPDGETGDRLTWVGWQIPILAEHPLLEAGEPIVVTGREFPRFRRRADAAGEPLAFGPLGYVEEARRSYELFARLREEGVLPAGPRFLVALPTPSALASVFVEADDQAEVAAAYEQALLREVAEIASAIPAGELAIQWDGPADVGAVEGVFPSYYAEAPFDGVVATLARLGAGVPEGVELGYHLCYGDTGDQDDPDGAHFMDPPDLGTLARVMDAVSSACPRTVDYYHLPVPIKRDDPAYFAPLADLRLTPSTRLSLGLLHREDGIEGAQRRIAAARTAVEDFDVAAECGMGRERTANVPELLTLHGEAVAAAAAA